MTCSHTLATMADQNRGHCALCEIARRDAQKLAEVDEEIWTEDLARAVLAWYNAGATKRGPKWRAVKELLDES